MIRSYQQLQEWLIPHLERLHVRLSGSDSLSALATLGLVSGLVAGLVMVAFRLLIESPQTSLFGVASPEDYENLPLLWRFLLPILGGLVIGIWFQRLAATDRQLGITHVIDSLAQRDGQLPLKNAGIQFFSAALSIVSGHSVGREGPSIHIGATCGSWMGQQLRLPNNSIRILVGCGAAGAIAAAFNTPLAGVIFAMEVIMIEYTLSGFIPIILAAVSATTVSRWVFGSAAIFVAPEVPLESLSDLFYIVLMGVLLGALASVFVRLLLLSTTLLSDHPLWLKMTCAGAVTGLLALFVPEIMGIGYDTVNAALLGELELGLLLAILVCKLVASAIGLGLGLPGGLIGPTLVMGAVTGGAIGILLNAYTPATTSPSFYAMLGMGALMGATLNAPLAALTALLELTSNPHIILPGMLAIVAAGLSSQLLFNTPSVFRQLLRGRGMDYPAIDPVSQFLRRLGVSASMDRRVQQLPATTERPQLEALLHSPPTWLLIRNVRPKPIILFTADLIRYLEASSATDQFDLADLPVQKLSCAPISTQATLLGALRKMDKQEVDALYVISAHSGRLLGIITRQTIEHSYRYSST